ncbi:pseudouridine synthase [Thiocystis violacea]|uniref:pseudouridine synthase n=1 Tax=Thiocystis violacea TaxID=13725 RepID=UPI00190865D5|nr:pseudouridine synthase [Thiocystis violacea]MBK1721472.1 pseudouridine synthase [Thiocystis violacea]
MSRLVLLNKPYGVLSQFTGGEPGAGQTLADYVPLPGVYPAGRLDKDSEGLLLLTDDGRLQHAISHPRHKAWKTYWVQVEGTLEEARLERLRAGVMLKDGPTRPARVEPLHEPDLWTRDPPVRFRKSVPTAWVSIAIQEGRNRQVRRMTAAVGLPTLRLVRVAIGDWRLGDLQPGQYRTLQVATPTTDRPADTRQRTQATQAKRRRTDRRR